MEEMEADTQRILPMKNRLEKALLAMEQTFLNGALHQRLPHTCNLSFKYVESETLMMGFNKKIAVSSGSACTSASMEPSYVLKAMGLSDDLAHASLRFGLGRFTPDEQIDFAIQTITDAVNQLRKVSPIWEMYKDGIL
jgi:cysteine desulfurase